MMRKLLPSVLPSVASLFLALHVGAQSGPQNVVREFCRLDAMGARITLQGWPSIQPLVDWIWEPAWDRVVLITSYTVGWPMADEEDRFVVEVRYAVQGVVTAAGLREQPGIESRVFRVYADSAGVWRIAGPPPPPRVFSHYVDVEGMRRSLAEGGVNFVANSTFVHWLFRNAGWEVPWVATGQLMRGDVFREVLEGKPGDLVLYLDGADAYHVGVLEQEGVVVSSTLNAGIARTPIDGFPGERKVLRLVEPPPTATAAPNVVLQRRTPTPPAETLPMRRGGTGSTHRTLAKSARKVTATPTKAVRPRQKERGKKR